MDRQEVIDRLLDQKMRDVIREKLEDMYIYPSTYSEAEYEKACERHRKKYGRYALLDEFMKDEPKEYITYDRTMARIINSFKR